MIYHKSFFTFLRGAIACLLLALASCDKVPINGPLDGMWQLMEIEQPNGRQDVKANRIYISFQLHLTQWEDLNNQTSYYAHFTHTADSLIFYDFAHPAKHDLSAGDNDHWITAEEATSGLLAPWGLHSLKARFAVRRLNSDYMTLQQQDTTLYFRKI